jgi:hypothetical protein
MLMAEAHRALLHVSHHGSCLARGPVVTEGLSALNSVSPVLPPRLRGGFRCTDGKDISLALCQHPFIPSYGKKPIVRSLSQSLFHLQRVSLIASSI